MTAAANPQRKYIWISLGFSLLGALMILAVNVADIDMMNGGGALILVGLLFFFTGLPVAVMFYRRYRLLEDILQGRGVLAHWRYEPELWARYAGEEELRDAADKKWLFMVVAIFALLAGGFFYIMDPGGGGPITLAVCCGLIVVIGLVAVGSHRWSARRNRTGSHEAYISAQGLYFNRMLHSWHHINTWLDSVRIVSARVPCIEFIYSYPSKSGMQSATVNVPIPAGEMEAAQKIAAYLASGQGQAGPDKQTLEVPEA